MLKVKVEVVVRDDLLLQFSIFRLGTAVLE